MVAVENLGWVQKPCSDTDRPFYLFIYFLDSGRAYATYKCSFHDGQKIQSSAPYDIPWVHIIIPVIL